MTKTTPRQDRAWSNRLWRRPMLEALNRWLRRKDTDEELAEAVMPFVEAVCTMKGLDEENRRRVERYTLSNVLPNLSKQRALGKPSTLRELWREFLWQVLVQADDKAEEQQEREYATIDEADRTMLRDSDDPTADIVERLERESEVEEITEAQLCHAVEQFPKFLAEWNQRSPEPIYRFLEAHASKYGPVIELQVLLGWAMFEEFMKKHAGQTLTIPSDRDLRKFEESRARLQAYASGETQTQIAEKLNKSQSAVSQELKNLKTRRLDSWWHSNQSFLKALSVAFNLMVRARARISLHMGSYK